MTKHLSDIAGAAWDAKFGGPSEPEAIEPEADTPADDVVDDAPEGTDQELALEALEGEADEAAAAEDEVAEDEEAEEAPDEGVVVVTEDTVIRLPDGSEVKVGEAALRQADYTRKTQQVAAERQEIEGLRQEVEQAREEIQSTVETLTSDPVRTMTEVVARSQDPSLTLAYAIKQLADAGKLSQQFLDTFGLESGPIAEMADKYEADDRVAALERKLEQQEQGQQAEAARRQALETYQRAFEDIVSSEALTFDTPEAKVVAFRDLLEYARDNQIADLGKAYAARAWEQSKQNPPPTLAAVPAATPPAAPSPSKQATRAVARKGASAAPVAVKSASIEDAASAAYDRLFGAA